MRTVVVVLIAVASGAVGGFCSGLYFAEASPGKELGPSGPARDRGWAVTEERVDELEKRTAELARAIEFFRLEVSPPTVASSEPVATPPAGEDSLEHTVVELLEAEQEEALQRRIVVRQERDSRFVDALGNDLDLKSDQLAAVEEIFFEATKRHLTAIDEAENGRKSWDEARAEMQTLQDDGRRRLKEVLSSEEYEALSAIASKYSTVLSVAPPPRAEVRAIAD